MSLPARYGPPRDPLEVTYRVATDISSADDLVTEAKRYLALTRRSLYWDGDWCPTAFFVFEGRLMLMLLGKIIPDGMETGEAFDRALRMIPGQCEVAGLACVTWMVAPQPDDPRNKKLATGKIKPSQLYDLRREAAAIYTADRADTVLFECARLWRQRGQAPRLGPWERPDWPDRAEERGRLPKAVRIAVMGDG